MKYLPSLLALWFSSKAVVDAFAFTPSGLQFAQKATSITSQTRLYETVEATDEVNTLLRSATIYGDVVADENVRFVNFTIISTYMLYVHL